ncbi:transcriptional regulator [Nocardiopsis sp. HNM0947]|uniref:Transcriptional regulator n=1 Tax=Nocardiopsis coralli TaxID=2772213 RepID=A0ABR9P0D0_9ACTN|nr:transcriptional regulator [Nocardiopsis coralli]MBE2997288.1 transcriptional regulator [Nocardiopsis coralli]
MYAPHVRRHALALLDSGISQTDVSRQTGINRTTLREWSQDRSLADKYLGTDLCPRCEPVPRPPTPAHAYSYLLGLYLGDGCLSPAGDPRKKIWRLRIACDDKWPGLQRECADAIAAVRPDHKVGRVQAVGCTMICGQWKHWPCVFPQHGPGKKHERLIALEPWQQVIVEEHSERFVRGLMHSDGSRVLNRIPKKDGRGFHAYPRYLFANTSRDIVGLFTDALDRLGIPWKAHVKRQPSVLSQRAISISRKDAVARMDTFVGPKY